MKQKIKASLKSLRLSGKVMQKVKGGDCRCGCMYADSGGSSIMDNHGANNLYGLHSPNCPDHDPPPIE
jgi:natural product precursor